MESFYVVKIKEDGCNVDDLQSLLTSSLITKPFTLVRLFVCFFFFFLLVHNKKHINRT